MTLRAELDVSILLQCVDELRPETGRHIDSRGTRVKDCQETTLLQIKVVRIFVTLSESNAIGIVTHPEHVVKDIDPD